MLKPQPFYLQKKTGCLLWVGGRGRLTKIEDKQLIINAIVEAIRKGARKKEVCKYFDIPLRTIQRWEKEIADKRQLVKREPTNKLSEAEEKQIISLCCSERFRDLSPREIVPMLASEGCYVASESTIYRILRREKLLAHRQRSKEPEKKRKVAHHKATGPGQVWSWDITYLKTNVKGMFVYLYLFMDVWSRKIVAWDVYREQSAENAREIVMNKLY